MTRVLAVEGTIHSRRSFLALIPGAYLTAALVACDDRLVATPAAQPTAATFSDRPTVPTLVASTGQSSSAGSTIEYWSNFGNDDAELTKKLLPAFEAANPGIKVNHTSVPTVATTQSSDKLVSAVKAGTPPDDSFFDRFIVTSWAGQGMLTDLTSRAKDDNLAKAQFLPEAWAEATYAGKLYATPFATDFRMLYYNTDHFQSVGLDPARPPTTIGELDTYADKLTKLDSGAYTRLGFVPWVYQGWLYTWGWLWGGEFYDESANKITANDPKIVAALEWVTSYARRYGVDKIDAFTAPFYSTSGSSSGEKHAFVKGQLSLMCEGDWEFANFKRLMKPEQFQAFDLVVLPKATGGPPTATWGGGWSIVIPKGARRVDPAWKFARWWSVEGQRLYVRDQVRIPTLLDLFDPKNFPDADPRWRKFLALRDQARFRPNIPVGQTLWTELANVVQDAIHAKGTAKELLDGVTERVNAELAKSGR